MTYTVHPENFQVVGVDAQGNVTSWTFASQAEYEAFVAGLRSEGLVP